MAFCGTGGGMMMMPVFHSASHFHPGHRITALSELVFAVEQVGAGDQQHTPYKQSIGDPGGTMLMPLAWRGRKRQSAACDPIGAESGIASFMVPAQQHDRPACMDGHFTVPKLQYTQQSPGFAFSTAPHLVQS